MRHLISSIILSLLISICTSVPAEAGILEKIFSSLKSKEKTVNSDLGHGEKNHLLKWMSMSPDQRQMLRHRYQQFRGLPSEVRSELERRYMFLESLAPEQQEILNKKYKFYSNLDPIKKAQIRRLYIFWQKMPDSQRQHLILHVEKIRNLPSLERERELSHSVIWQVFSPRERRSLGRFMNNLRIQVFPFLPDSRQNQDQQTKELEITDTK